MCKMFCPDKKHRKYGRFFKYSHRIFVKISVTQLIFII